MTQYLPPNLLALFAPRDPVPFLPPLAKLPHEKVHRQPYSGIAVYVHLFEDPKDAPPPTRAETKEERMERKRREKIEKRAQEIEEELKLWDAHTDTNVQGDAFKTLFVARINYDTSESKLRREFEVYGPIRRITMIYNKVSGKPRGYAFIEYEHERDMHSTIVMAMVTAGLQLMLVLPLTSRCVVGIWVCMMVRPVSTTKVKKGRCRLALYQPIGSFL